MDGSNGLSPEEFEEALGRYLRPQTFPVAIRLVPPEEPLPERVKRPWEDLEIKVAICQAISLTRHYGWAVAVGEEDLSCPIAKLVFGFAPKLEYFEAGHACVGIYTETLEAGAVSEAAVARFPYRQYEYLLVAPLHRASFEPDVIVIYGNSAQIMRLVTAALWKRGGRLTSSFSGRIDCSDSVIVPLQSEKPQVILPCYGDRVFAQTQDHEMAFALPASWMEEIVSGLEGTHQGGVRYPIPHWLRYTGRFPPQYEKMNELWKKRRG